MSQKARKTNHQNKKQAVLQNRKSRINPLALVIAGAAVVSVLALAYFITETTVAPVTPVSSSNASQAGASQVSYPVDLFADGTAKHFEHKDNGLTIKYFIIKSADGVLRAAFDACDVCWPAGKGYYQEGNDMVCRNCGRKFASELVNEVKGGCNPAPLNRRVQGDQLVIEVADILKGQSYFNFKGKV